MDHQKLEKEQNSVLCISSFPLTPTQQTWSPTGRLDCESSSSPLTIVLFFLSLSLPLFLLLYFFSFLPTVILEKPIRIPRSLSVKAASVLKGFLNKVRAVHCQSVLSFSLSSHVHCSSVKSPCVGSWPKNWAVFWIAKEGLFHLAQTGWVYVFVSALKESESFISPFMKEDIKTRIQH